MNSGHSSRRRPQNLHWVVLLCLLLILTLLAACSGSDDPAPSDGDNSDGDTSDGDEPDGDNPDGDSPDGDTDGDSPDGDTPIDGDTDIEVDDDALDVIRINEIDCHGRDWVEIINGSPANAYDISGWLISDDLAEAGHKYALPSGSVIEPGGFLVVKEAKDSDPGMTFGLKCDADTVSLVAPGGILVDQQAIPAVPESSTWGRLPDFTGDWQETLPTQGEANQLPSSLTDSLFTIDTVYDIQLTLSEASQDALNLEPYEYVEAEFSVVLPDLTVGPYTVGVRLKSGLSFRSLAQKAAFKIAFDKYDSDLRLFGLKNLTLNNMVQDPSMMHETIAYKIYRGFGVPAPRTGYATVTVNGDAYGLYAVIEKYDDISLDRMFDKTQHLYEGASVDLSSGNAGRFEVDEGDKSDISDLEAFISIINDTADDSWAVEMSKVSDLPEIVRMWVIENYIGQSDGYTVSFNNYYLHSDDRGLFSMLPWGADQTFSDDLDLPTGDSLLITRCFEISYCESLYYQQLDVLQPLVDSLHLAQVIDDLETLIAPYVDNDPRKEYTVAEFEQAVSDMKAYLAARKSELDQ